MSDVMTAGSAGTSTLMGAEAGEAPEAIARLLARNAPTVRALAERLRAAPPPVIITIARGSSDHAATYGKYILETKTGVPVSSAAPSVASIFETPMKVQGALVIAISQSGRSPDLLATVEAYRAGGAHIVALVNDEESPLATGADTFLPLSAGPEKAVAATKSCLTALAGLAQLAAAWAGDETLEAALNDLPGQVEQALGLDWSPAVEGLREVSQMFVLGRGYGYGVAQEAALKLKETCSIQAEPFSAAEVRHGPMRIVEPGYSVLGFATSDVAGEDVKAVADQFAARGAKPFVAGQGGALPMVAGHPALEPIAMLASFYRMVEALALARGMDPDSPPHLQKVTRTL